MAKDMNDTLVETSIEASFKMERRMEEVSMNGETVKYMMGIGLQG